MNDLQLSGYDLIGDIHGHADALSELLESMEYQLSDGYYRHPTRQVIFLGDFIDRGQQQVKVLKIVMPMIKHGSALSVMGNHEFNALAFHTPCPDQPDTWLRPHTNKNIKQHQAFLDEFVGRKEWPTLDDALAFFESLPLWLDLDGLRVVHACWDPRFVGKLGPLLRPGNKVTPELLIAASTIKTTEFDAIETLLKGVEYALPGDHSFLDKDGTPRTNARIQWWKNGNRKLGEITLPADLLVSEENVHAFEHQVFEAELLGYPSEDKPVFLGHFWMDNHPAKLASNVACLDYSVANGGKLVAYRWSGEQKINDDNFHYMK